MKRKILEDVRIKGITTKKVIKDEGGGRKVEKGIQTLASLQENAEKYTMEITVELSQLYAKDKTNRGLIDVFQEDLVRDLFFAAIRADYPEGNYAYDEDSDKKNLVYPKGGMLERIEQSFFGTHEREGTKANDQGIRRATRIIADAVEESLGQQVKSIKDLKEPDFLVDEIGGIKVPWRPVSVKYDPNNQIPLFDKETGEPVIDPVTGLQMYDPLIKVPPTYHSAISRGDWATAYRELSKATDTVIEASSAVKLPGMFTRIYVSEVIPKGSMAILTEREHGVDGVIVNESWAELKQAWDADGDTAMSFINKEKAQGLIVKQPLNKRPPTLSLIEWNRHLEHFEDFSGFEEPKIYSLEERLVDLIKAHTPNNPGTPITAMNGKDVAHMQEVLNQPHPDGRPYTATEYANLMLKAYAVPRAGALGEERFAYVETGGMKASRKEDSNELKQVDFQYRISGPGSIPYNSFVDPDLALYKYHQIHRAFYNVQMKVEKVKIKEPTYSRETVPQYGNGHQTLDLMMKRGWLRVVEIDDHLLVDGEGKPLKTISISVHNNQGDKVPIVTKKLGQEETWTDYILTPFVDMRSGEPVLTSPLEILAEYLGKVGNLVGKDKIPFGIIKQHLEWYGIVASNIFKQIQEYVGKYGIPHIPANRYGEGGVPSLGPIMATRGIRVLFDSVATRSIEILKVNKWLMDHGYFANITGGLKGNLKDHGMYYLVDSPDKGNAVPFWAHHTCKGKRVAEISPQLMRSQALGKVPVLVVGASKKSTKSVTFITDEGIENTQLLQPAILKSAVPHDKIDITNLGDSEVLLTPKFGDNGNNVVFLKPELKKTRKVGKYITAGGMKSMGLPLGRVEAKKEDGTTVLPYFVVSQHEVEAKGCQGEFAEESEEVTAIINGKEVKALLCYVRYYRTLSPGDNLLGTFGPRTVSGSSVYCFLSAAFQVKPPTFNVDYSKPINESVDPTDMVFADAMLDCLREVESRVPAGKMMRPGQYEEEYY